MIPYEQLVLKNGKEDIPFKGVVSDKIIVYMATDIPFEKGNVIIRKLKNGVEEKYLIEDAQNCHEHHYELHCCKE